ncbi:MAG: hypothetical protein CMO12_01485 [Thaumarchaeota archaeon]|nr:hypothetical protein [Nitrososphaerota archaeon]
MYKSLFRPVLFKMKPERAQEVSKFFLKRRSLWRPVSSFMHVKEEEMLRTNFAGIPLKNPVGLAAGFDKYCEMIGTMMELGFGYAVSGSIVYGARDDNPKPMYVRYPEKESLVNCTGIPSKGIDYALKGLMQYTNRKTPIIANVQDFDIDGYLNGFKAVQPLVDAVEIGLICPNEKYEGCNPIEEETFDQILTQLKPKKSKPILVKIRNYHNEKERENRFELIRMCMKHDVDGITLPGSMSVKEPKLSLGAGNLTGRAIFHNTLRNIHDVWDQTNGKVPIKALGGIFRGKDAFEAIKAGATTVESVTGMIYEGWSYAKQINSELVNLLKENKFSSLDELRGYANPQVAAA